MREILFRGQSIDRRKWYEGDLYQTRLKSVFYINYYNQYGDRMAVEIAPETIGQYTGLTDINGKKIFEGDIIKAQDDVFGSPFCNGITGKVVYEETAFFIEPEDPMESQWLFNECAVYEVIGNIYDNPELLKPSLKPEYRDGDPDCPICPNCRTPLREMEDCDCGQKIDWSEE